MWSNPLCMVRLTQIKLPLDHAEEDLRAAILRKLRISVKELVGYAIFKRSYDARKKDAIAFVYIVDVEATTTPRC